jgi:hypothetical protein
LEKKKVLPKGGSKPALEALAKLPAGDEQKEAAVNKSLTRALSQYGAISMSAGMPVGEVVQAAVSAAAGELPASVAGRRVYYELSRGGFAGEAAKKNAQEKEEALDDIFSRAAAASGRPAVIIGGVSGTPLSEKGFSRDILKETYGYGDKEAAAAEEFLHDVRVRDGLAPEGLAAIVSAAEAALRQGTGNFQRNFLNVLDARNDVAYNLAGESGRGAYARSGRFRAAGFAPESLEELAAVRMVPASAASGAGIRDVAPVCRSRGGIAPVTRSVPKGSPEPVQRGYRDTDGAFRAYAQKAKREAPHPPVPEVVPIRTAPVNQPEGFDVPGSDFAHSPGFGQRASGTPDMPQSGRYPAGFEGAGEARGIAGRGGAGLPSKKGVARPRPDEEGAELARLRRIEANYEKDKAMLERQPALARSDTHDVGHAEGAGEADETAIKKMSAKFENLIKNEVDNIII